jgi:hypothetical protein
MTNALISIVFFVLSTNAWAPSALVQKELVKPRLSVVIRSAKSSYNIRENIDFEIRLENVGQESLLVCRWLGWAPGRTELRVLDSHGKDVYTNFLADEVPPPLRDKDFIELKPDKFFRVRLGESATDFVNTPGSYVVFVKYRSPASEEWARRYLHLPHLPLWSSEQGTVISNRIRVEITK